MSLTKSSIAHFNYCPRCGVPTAISQKTFLYVCNSCDLNYYVNTAAAVGGILWDSNGRILLTEREQDPMKGMWDVPGGFLDPLETAEAGLRREVEEELGVRIEAICYLGSFPNRYEYKGILYFTLDLFYSCRVEEDAQIKLDLDEITSASWWLPHEINLDAVGFESARRAIQLIQTRH